MVRVNASFRPDEESGAFRLFDIRGEGGQLLDILARSGCIKRHIVLRGPGSSHVIEDVRVTFAFIGEQLGQRPHHGFRNPKKGITGDINQGKLIVSSGGVDSLSCEVAQLLHLEVGDSLDPHGGAGYIGTLFKGSCPLECFIVGGYKNFGKAHGEYSHSFVLTGRRHESEWLRAVTAQPSAGEAASC